VADRSRSLEETSTRIPVRKKDDCNHDESPLVLRKQKRTRRLPQRTREMRFASAILTDSSCPRLTCVEPPKSAWAR
jgi:hypothetical protein